MHGTQHLAMIMVGSYWHDFWSWEPPGLMTCPEIMMVWRDAVMIMLQTMQTILLIAPTHHHLTFYRPTWTWIRPALDKIDKVGRKCSFYCVSCWHSSEHILKIMMRQDCVVDWKIIHINTRIYDKTSNIYQSRWLVHSYSDYRIRI